MLKTIRSCAMACMASLAAAHAQERTDVPRLERWLQQIPRELRFEDPPVPEADNAYGLLLKAMDAFVDLPDEEDLEDAFFDSYDSGCGSSFSHGNPIRLDLFPSRDTLPLGIRRTP